MTQETEVRPRSPGIARRDNAYECSIRTRPLSLSPIEIPERFHRVCYNDKCYPRAPGVRGVTSGANCQQYAYEFVRAFGYAIPDLRSSGLWADKVCTATVERPEPFDFVLLNGKPDPWGAHVGVYLGKGLVLHLCKKIGVPPIESIESLTQRRKYRCLIGFKRILVEQNVETASYSKLPADGRPAEEHPNDKSSA